MENKEQDFQTMKGEYLPFTTITSGMFQQAAPGVYSFTVQIVNIAFVKTESGFVMIDAGMPDSQNAITMEIDNQFGAGAKPEAIVLTHGHFDHVGGLEALLEQWGDIPVYAHPLEFPYLTGQKSYPEPDPTVEGGLVAKMSPLFPHHAINIGSHLKSLPEDGTIPPLPDWRWIHTPGHSQGHVSLFREEDKTLIAGDAFITVKQDELFKVMAQVQEVHGPPRYLTTDWEKAKASVKKLAALKPNAAITGHGTPMSGEKLQTGLEKLAMNFDTLAKPDYGKYV